MNCFPQKQFSERAICTKYIAILAISKTLIFKKQPTIVCGV
ncbi:hypothetical protein APA_437 [Pseudanabaena sp. lw0831]|nr:hypothetical protein APA_437 [Pseudanabaena sp. lw0831]